MIDSVEHKFTWLVKHSLLLSGQDLFYFIYFAFALTVHCSTFEIVLSVTGLYHIVSTFVLACRSTKFTTSSIIWQTCTYLFNNSFPSFFHDILIPWLSFSKFIFFIFMLFYYYIYLFCILIFFQCCASFSYISLLVCYIYTHIYVCWSLRYIYVCWSLRYIYVL